MIIHINPSALTGVRRKLAQRISQVSRTPARAGRRLGRLLRPSPFPMGVRLGWMVGRDGEDFWSRARLVSACCRRGADGDYYYHLGGKRFYFHPDFQVEERELREGIELILRECYLDPEEEPEAVRVRSGDVVLDLGGNIGTLAMRYAEEVSAHGYVFSFEPVMHRPLARNVRENGFTNIEVIPLAVADRCGQFSFRVHGNCIDSRITPSSGTAVATGAHPALAYRGSSRATIDVPVEVTTIDAWVEQRGIERVDVIKSDIEGAEELAMRGAQQTVERFHPRWIISSYHTDSQGRKQHPRLVALLKDWGYRVTEVDARRIFAW